MAAPLALVAEAPAFPLQAQAGLALAASGLALAPFAGFVARRIAPGRRVVFARWGFTHLLLVVAVFYLSAVLLESAWPATADESVDLGLVRSVVVLGITALAAAFFARRLAPDGLRSLGFPSGSNARAVGAGAACYLLLAPAIFGLGLLWPTVIELFGGDWQPQAVALGFTELPAARLAGALLLGIVVVPFLEELLFRGFLQPLLVQNFRDRGGVALTSFCFAALHGRDAFLPIFALALVLGGVKLRTQRLAGCWTVHALHNALTLALLLGVEDVRNLVP